jgi:histidinol dehydrogenase
VLKASAKSLSPADRKAIRESIAMVKDFHKKTLPKAWKGRNAQGGIVGERFYPIQRVGLYIPGGNVPLVSTVIMTAVLAKLVKCPEIAVCTPPDAEGNVAPAMLAALSIIGIDEVYKVGGVQAIAAMAYGTQTIPAVDKIFGPGNAFVMEAKRQVLGTVGIDLLPGPSEVMIIADAGANPRHVAADLLAQAEHGSGKEIIYFATTSKVLLKKIEKAIAQQMPALSHADKCAKVLDGRCLAVTCKNLSQAAEVANYIAPEHLELQVADASIEPLSQQITTAGAILQGYFTPTVLGDFTAGPSHTLPTGRAGRFFSGLQATDFMRRSSTVRYDAKSLAKAAPIVEAFARLEQLDAHGKSLTIRL